MSVTMRKTATTQTVAILNLAFAECRTTSSLSSGRRAANLRRSKQMVGLVAIEFVLEDEICGVLDQILDRVVDKFSWPPHNLVFDSRVRLVLSSTKTPVFSRRGRSAAHSDVGMVLGRDFAHSCTVLFSPPMFNGDCR